MMYWHACTPQEECPPPPSPLPMFEADSQNFALAPSVPRGFTLKYFGLPSAGTIGGPWEEGGSQPKPPPRPPLRIHPLCGGGGSSSSPSFLGIWRTYSSIQSPAPSSLRRWGANRYAANRAYRGTVGRASLVHTAGGMAQEEGGLAYARGDAGHTEGDTHRWRCLGLRDDISAGVVRGRVGGGNGTVVLPFPCRLQFLGYPLRW